MGNPFIAAALRNLADLHILAKSPKFDDQMNFVKMCDTLRLNVKHSSFHKDWDKEFVAELVSDVDKELAKTSKTAGMGYFDIEGYKACQKKLVEVKRFMEMNGAA